MTPTMNHLTALLARLWRTDAPLTGVGLLMLAALIAFVAGIWLDPRTILGAPAWLKPAKFAVSTGVYSLTLAWVFTYLPTWPRVRRVVSRTTVTVFVVEVAIIAFQAWRGTTSHFNVATPFDATLFAVMGLAILLQTLMSMAVAVALWRQTFADRALGWALRLGLTITIVGAASGGLMTQPTAEQLAGARATHRMTVAGAHTVGGPDGGPGLPVTGWSLEHGDLRAPHFVGLHALQLLPLVTMGLVPRRWPESKRVRLTIVIATSYALLFALLLWQGLRGQSIVAPDVMTLSMLAIWALLTATAARMAAAAPPPAQVHPVVK